MPKKGLGIDVLTAAKERISWTFDEFDKIYCSFSAGKDSGVMVHLVCEEEFNNWENERPLRIVATALRKLKS